MSGQTHFSHVLVIENPKSGQTESRTSAFIEALGREGVYVEVRELGSGPIEALLHDVEDFGAVVAAGGDGTVSAVAHALNGRLVPLLAYPAGTANLIAQNLHLPGDPRELARILLAGHTLTIDLAEMEVDGRTVGFTMLAGAGADAAMIRDSEALKSQFGVSAYVVAALRQVNHPRVPFRITVDDALVEVEAVAVMVANFGMANFRLPIANGISPTDGLLTVVVVTNSNRLGLLPDFINSLRSRLNLGDPVFTGNIEVFQARSVTVEADQPLPVQYDGEACGDSTPFTARVLPGAVRFLTEVSEDDLLT